MMNTKLESIGFTKQDRLVQANSILETLNSKELYLSLSNGSVIVSWRSGERTISKRWVTRGSDFFPTFSLPIGGTKTMALSQLVRWVQGKPVFAMPTWEYWAKLFGNGTLEALRAIGWPEKNYCVLCGKEPAGLDWWNLDGVSGPCCNHGCSAEGFHAIMK